MKDANSTSKNLCFEENKDVDRANVAYCKTSRDFYVLYNFAPSGKIISAFDKDTGDVLFFFDSDLVNQSNSIKKKFIQKLKSNWREAGFEIIGEKTYLAYTYPRIRYNSLCFRLRSII